MKIQSLKNKLGEISFRQNITSPQTRKKFKYKNELDFRQRLKELKKRIKKSHFDFKNLQKKGLDLSFYLEIGAENCQRAMILEEKFKAKGFATDISLESLKGAKDFLKPLGFKKLPQRIVCDASNLPFLNSSIPFIFCYQTLHHFPNPKPVLKEIYRVLAPNGSFFFSEEPVKQTLNLPIWRRPTVLRPWERLLKYVGILPFISRIGKTEVEYGILEETFSLTIWQRALDVFDYAEVKIEPYPKGPQSTIKKNGKDWLKPKFPTNVFIFLLGGGISAICQKRAGLVKPKQNLISSFLCCPKCKQKLESKDRFYCKKCNIHYPKITNIPILLKPQDLKKLYCNFQNV